MNELYQVIILIFLVCSSLVTNSCGQHVCVESGIACDSCTALALCQGTEKTTNPCPSGKLCGEITETMAGCFDSSKTEAKACKCTKWPSLKADPYDGQNYIACITPTFQLYEECGDDKIFIESEQECLESTTSPPTTPTTPLPPPECDEEGFFTNDPTCKTWYYCFTNDTTLQATTINTCQPPEYLFDDRVKECVPEADLKPKKFVCPSDVDGGVMDTEKCDVFHICFGGTEVGDPIPCEEGYLFDKNNMTCSPEGEVYPTTCPQLSNCLLEGAQTMDSTLTGMSSSITASSKSTTTLSTGTQTTTSTTTAPAIPTCSSNGAFPYPGDCTKYYWCANGRYSVKSCPVSYLFDKTKGYCNTAANVSGC